MQRFAVSHGERPASLKYADLRQILTEDVAGRNQNFHCGPAIPTSASWLSNQTCPCPSQKSPALECVERGLVPR